MRTVITLLAVTGFAWTSVAQDTAKPIAFTKADAGKLPAGWSTAVTGKGEGSRWEVLADDTTPSKSGYSLVQLAKAPTQVYNLCVLDGSNFKDGEISVQFKSISGKIDQGGGVVWRYKDANNYYICRYNPLEANFRLYHVKDGVRSQLASQAKLDFPAGKWFELKVKHVGNMIECFVDGKSFLTIEDDTFPEAGKLGLWTKADAETAFDGLRYTK